MRDSSITMRSAGAVSVTDEKDDEKQGIWSYPVHPVQKQESLSVMDQMDQIGPSSFSESEKLSGPENTELLEQFKNSLLTFRALIASHYGDTEPSGDEQLTLPQRIAKGVAWVRTHPSDLNAIKALNGLRARETKMFERESDEANRMSEIERELCGDGRVICSQCFEIYSVDRDCACGFWPWADGKRQEQEERLSEIVS